MEDKIITEDKSIGIPGANEILERFSANRHQNLVTTVLNRPYIPKIELKRSLEQICSNITAAGMDMGNHNLGKSKKDTGDISGKSDNGRVLQLVGSPVEEDKTDRKLNFSLTFISDDTKESSSTDLLFESAKQLSSNIENIYVIARVKRPVWLPKNILYTRIGLGGDIVSAIQMSDLIICSSYTLLESIKIANEVPLIYFAYEDIYLDIGVDLKEKIILAAALGCVDAAICFNSHIYKKLSHQYGLSVILMNAGVDINIFAPPAGLAADLERMKNHSETGDLKTDSESEKTADGKDNFWHLQRDSLYRKNGLFGKNRFDYSYHFMMREENPDSNPDEVGTDASDDQTAPIEDVAFPQPTDTGGYFQGTGENYSRTVLFVIDDASDLYGLDILIKVAEDLNNKNPDVKVLAASRQAIAGFPSNTEVRIIGDAHDLVQIYAIADIYVGAEKSSNFAEHALEAMSIGVPVVSSDHYGIVDFARHGDNVMLAPVADSKSILDLIRRVLYDDELQGRLKGGGLETASLRSWPLVAKSYINLFSSVADVYFQAKQISPLPDAKVTSGNDRLPGAFLKSGKKDNKLESDIREMPNGRYAIFLKSEPSETLFSLEDLEFESATAAGSLVRYLENMNFARLAVPVSRGVTDKISRVSWEMIATRKSFTQDDTGSIRYVYLPAFSKPVRFLKGANPALVDFGNGNYGEALKTLTGSVKVGNTKSRAAVSRWIILTLLGLGRKEDALKLALTWRDSFMLHPDFYLLAYHVAKQANMSPDYADTREKIEMLGAGGNYGEWFESPLELLEEDALLP